MDDLIKKLAEAWGPSGFEHQVRDLIRAEVEALADEVRVDALGNLICRVGDGPQRIMLAAHMDELGVIVSHIDRQGYARFASIGTLYPASLFGGRVRFENGILGTIGYDSAHSKRREVPDLSGFYLDISTGSDDPPAIGVGDPAAFVAPVETRGSRIVGKSLDNRVGCAVLIETMRRLHNSSTPHSVYFVFTVQEEVGARGAQPAAYSIEPHLGFAVDVTATGDQPKGRNMSVALGKGVAIKTREVGLIVPMDVRDLLTTRAEENGIPYQMEVLVGGGTDGRMIQLARAGVPTGAVSIPLRNVHTTAETVERGDVEAAVDLLSAVLANPIDRQ